MKNSGMQLACRCGGDGGREKRQSSFGPFAPNKEVLHGGAWRFSAGGDSKNVAADENAPMNHRHEVIAMLSLANSDGLPRCREATSNGRVGRAARAGHRKRRRILGETGDAKGEKIGIL